MFNEHKKRGFTIIEIMLSLSITAALLAAIMSTVMISINREKYNDSVASFRDYLQSQYDNVNNVSFSKTTNKNDAEAKDSSCSSNKNKKYGYGRSDCYIVGRLINVRQDNNMDNNKIIVRNVLYKDKNTSADKLSFVNFFESDINLTNKEKKVADGLFITSLKSEELSIKWGAIIKQPNGKIKNHTILILKSVDDGSIKTYVRQGEYSRASELIGRSSDIDFCLHPGTNPYQKVRAIRINKNAFNSSGVQIMPTDVNSSVSAVECK